jgi:hypothetical protein
MGKGMGFSWGKLGGLQVGITLVGISSVLSGEGSQTHHVETWEMLMGMGLIVASQVHTSPLIA